MDLTPIRIPGKNRKDKIKIGYDTRKSLPKKGKLGRPLKLTTSPDRVFELTKPVRKPKIKQRTLKNIKSRRKMSLLEALPIELLENIFFYCMDLSLPRSSPVIAGKLSSPLVYNQTLEAAFRNICGEQSFYPTSSTAEDLAQLQSNIIRCRWFSLPLILKATNSWVERRSSDPKARQIANYSFEFYFKNFCELSEKMSTEYDSEMEKKMLGVWATDGPALSYGVQIPNSILEGPWDENMMRLFFWMVKWQAKIDWCFSTSGEVALVGLRNAIVTGDIRALHLLVQAGVREKIDGHLVIWALRNAGGKKVTVVNTLLMLMPNFTSLDQRNIRNELAEMRDEAASEKDEQKENLVTSIIEFNRSIHETHNLWNIIDIQL